MRCRHRGRTHPQMPSPTTSAPSPAVRNVVAVFGGAVNVLSTSKVSASRIVTTPVCDADHDAIVRRRGNAAPVSRGVVARGSDPGERDVRFARLRVDRQQLVVVGAGDEQVPAVRAECRRFELHCRPCRRSARDRTRASPSRGRRRRRSHRDRRRLCWPPARGTGRPGTVAAVRRRPRRRRARAVARRQRPSRGRRGGSGRRRRR